MFNGEICYLDKEFKNKNKKLKVYKFISVMSRQTVKRELNHFT